MGADPASSRLEPRTQGTNEVSEEGLPIGFCSGAIADIGVLEVDITSPSSQNSTPFCGQVCLHSHVVRYTLTMRRRSQSLRRFAIALGIRSQFRSLP